MALPFAPLRRGSTPTEIPPVNELVAPGGAMGNLTLGQTFDAIFRGDEGELSTLGKSLHHAAPRPGPVTVWRTHWAAAQLQKSVELTYWKSAERAQKAAIQGTIVNSGLDHFGGYDTEAQNDKTQRTFQLCRKMADDNEVVGAIIGKRVEQVAAFSRRAVVRRGQVSEPGFRVKLSDPNEKASKDDQTKIAEYEMYLLECGYCEPPEAERPHGWQPGLDMFLRQLVRDSLTIDHVAVRRWPSASLPKKFPVVAFCCVDAAKIQHRRPEIIEIKNGVPKFRDVTITTEDGGVRNLVDVERDAIDPARIVRFLKFQEAGGSDAAASEGFTRAQMFTGHRRPRTDENAFGYGYSEIEELFTAATLWCAARDFNGARFSKNMLPRGFFTIMANSTQQQFQQFQLAMKEMMQGVTKHNTIPVFQGSPQTGSSVLFNPIDLSPKDMEHGQSMFTFGLWMHCIYQIHPDETGFSSASPFRSALSEASPETNLKYSMDTGLRPLLRWIENLINREILWKLDPSRRYSFEFVGVGDYDELQDIQVRTARLQAGLSTPKQEWAELDVVMDPQYANHPAADFPAPFAVGMQMIQGAQQQAFAQKQSEQQAQQTQQQQQFGQDMQKVQAAGQGGPPIGDGQDDGSQGDAPPGGGSPVGTPPGMNNPASPILKAIGWPFV